MLSKWSFFKKEPKEEKKEEPRTTELAWGDSAFLSYGGGFEKYNPDILVNRKGAGIYRKMLNDAQVKAVYNLIVNIIISREFNFVKQSDDPIQDDIINFFQHNINIVIKGTWIKALKAVMLGKAQGYSVSEKIWKVEQYQGKEHWFIKNVKSKPYDSFDFVIDQFDNLKSIKQERDGTSRRLDPTKFIIYVNNPDLDPIWGDSDLKAAYRSYWEKDIIRKFWAIWLERMAGGFIVASPQENAPELLEPHRTSFQNSLKNIQKSTSILAPQGFEIKAVNPTDTEAFEKAIVFQNREIAKALLVPDLLGFSERGSNGSRSLGETQFDAFMMIVKEQGDYLADVMNEQFFSQLAWFNFGVTDYPVYKFESFTVKQKREIASAWGDAVGKGIVVNTFDDETRTREYLQYPQREEGEGEEETKEEPKEEKKESNNATERTPENTGEFYKLLLEEKRKQIEFAEEETTSFKSRVDFVELKEEFEENELVFVKDLAGPVDALFKEIDTYYKETIKSLPSDKGDIKYDEISAGLEKVVTVDSASIRRDLRNAFKKNFGLNYKDGRESAKDILNDTIKDLPKDIQQQIKFKISQTKSFACKEDVWTVANFLDGVNLEAIQEWIRSKSFTETKGLSESMLETAQQILINGITDEKGYKEIVLQLEQALSPILGTKDPETGKTDKANRARLETIARTNITNIFNQAQLSVYADPELGDFVDGLEYAATMDSRTTAFCRAYDDRKFKRTDPIWSTITPPNHFNCRSVMIPITIYDQWSPSRVLTSVQPSQGFG